MKMAPWSGIIAIAVFGIAVCAAGGQPSSKQLEKQAKITKNRAEQIALSRVAHGSIQSAEIEREKGHLVWSFDLSKPETKNITEVLVDAMTGKIISVTTENAAQQAAEAKAETH